MASHNPIVIEGGGTFGGTVVITGPGGDTVDISVTTDDGGNGMLVFDGPVSASTVRSDTFTGVPCYLNFSHNANITEPTKLKIGEVLPGEQPSHGYLMPKDGKVTDMTMTLLTGDPGEEAGTARFDVYKNGSWASGSITLSYATGPQTISGSMAVSHSLCSYDAGDAIAILATPSEGQAFSKVTTLIRIEET